MDRRTFLRLASAAPGVALVTEGHEKRAGSNPPPSPAKPDFAPPGQAGVPTLEFSAVALLEGGRVVPLPLSSFKAVDSIPGDTGAYADLVFGPYTADARTVLTGWTLGVDFMGCPLLRSEGNETRTLEAGDSLSISWLVSLAGA